MSLLSKAIVAICRTGLGLSLSYDIITRSYGGELRVKCTEGEEAEFVVQLPIKNEKT